MKIIIDADRMRSAGDTIRSINSELEKNMESIELLVESLNGPWQGDAERAYFSRLIYVRHEFVKLERFLDAYAMLLKSFADNYLAHEEEIASQIMSI